MRMGNQSRAKESFKHSAPDGSIKTLVIALAAGLLYPMFGILLSPIVAATAMSFSSVSVIANALRLQTVELK